MSLVYLITGLPRMGRAGPPPIERGEFVRRCREALEGVERAEFELMLQLEAVEETVRLGLKAELEEAGRDLAAAVLTDRRDGVVVDDLPEWLRRPAPQHVLMRRHYYEVTEHARTEFLRSWANFRVDIGEVITALLCRVEGVSRDAFLVQMQGSFDASAPLIQRHWEDQNLGLNQRFPWLPRVIAALNDDDLMAMSRTLDDVLWEKIEALSTHPLFSVETVLAYYLQLRILEREGQWDAAHGKSTLDAILAGSAVTTTETFAANPMGSA